MVFTLTLSVLLKIASSFSFKQHTSLKSLLILYIVKPKKIGFNCVQTIKHSPRIEFTFIFLTTKNQNCILSSNCFKIFFQNLTTFNFTNTKFLLPLKIYLAHLHRNKHNVSHYFKDINTKFIFFTVYLAHLHRNKHNF